MGSRHGLPNPLPLALGLLVDVEPGFVLVPYVAAEFLWGSGWCNGWGWGGGLGGGGGGLPPCSPSVTRSGPGPEGCVQLYCMEDGIK